MNGNNFIKYLAAFYFQRTCFELRIRSGICMCLLRALLQVQKKEENSREELNCRKCARVDMSALRFPVKQLKSFNPVNPPCLPKPEKHQVNNSSIPRLIACKIDRQV